MANGYRGLPYVDVPQSLVHGFDQAEVLMARMAQPRLPNDTERDLSLVGQLPRNIFEHGSSRLVTPVVAFTPDAVPVADTFRGLFDALGIVREPAMIGVDTSVANRRAQLGTEIARLRPVVRGKHVTLIHNILPYPEQMNQSALLLRAAGAVSIAPLEGAWYVGLGGIRTSIPELASDARTEQRMLRIGGRCAVKYVEYVRDQR